MRVARATARGGVVSVFALPLACLALLCACSQTLEVLSTAPPPATPPPLTGDAGIDPVPDDVGDITTGDAGAPPAPSPCGTCGVLELCAVDTCVDASGVTAIASWLGHTCKVHDGRLFCWGDNAEGQLGTGDTAMRDVPTRVGSFNDWLAVATSETHTCAIRAPGALYCFGDNASGQLATGDTRPRFEPTAIDTPWPLRAISCGGTSCCAIGADARLACWGDNLEGKLGQDDPFGSADATELREVQAGTRFASVGVGQGHVCAILESGELRCWGRNVMGELGLGSVDPGQLRAPQRVGDASDWRSIGGSQHHTCGVRADGSLWCWGHNMFHELSAPELETTFPAPRRVGADVDWHEVAVGWFHSCARKRDGRMFCWGRAIEGQLGVESIDPLLEPNLITAPARFTRIALGHFHSCGVDELGALYCWGMNDDGQLGVGDLERRHVPSPLP
jgi:alpha-tubulin suppressor-like RCC1 family protein